MEFNNQVNEELVERFNLVAERVEAIKGETTVHERY